VATVLLREQLNVWFLVLMGVFRVEHAFILVEMLDEQLKELGSSQLVSPR
jgi:hypothetical protein